VTGRQHGQEDANTGREKGSRKNQRRDQRGNSSTSQLINGKFCERNLLRG
jgi:hypothetical protein